ncbi:hypothetical protein N9W89_13160 [Hellea sp.]|nr:hypothetical protein [Hellea sp.]
MSVSDPATLNVKAPERGVFVYLLGFKDTAIHDGEDLRPNIWLQLQPLSLALPQTS